MSMFCPFFFFANLHTFLRHFEKVSHIFADAAFVVSFSSKYDDLQEILKKSDENLTKNCKNLLPLVNFDEVLLIFFARWCEGPEK